MKSLVFAVDFDGTCVTNAFPAIGRSVGAAPVLRLLVSKGHRIILYTQRDNVKMNLSPAVDWFRKRNIPLYAVNDNPGQSSWSSSRKIFSNVCIDDHNLGCPLIYPVDENGENLPAFVDWSEVAGYLLDMGIIDETDYDNVISEINAKWSDLKRNGVCF